MAFATINENIAASKENCWKQQILTRAGRQQPGVNATFVFYTQIDDT